MLSWNLSSAQQQPESDQTIHRFMLVIIGNIISICIWMYDFVTTNRPLHKEVHILVIDYSSQSVSPHRIIKIASTLWSPEINPYCRKPNHMPIHISIHVPKLTKFAVRLVTFNSTLNCQSLSNPVF